MKLPSVNSRSYLNFIFAVNECNAMQLAQEICLHVMYFNLCCWLVCVFYIYMDISIYLDCFQRPNLNQL